ncbi:cytochrome P450 [Streptomyces chattanoogensis]
MSRRDALGVPRAPGGLPLLGHTPKLARGPLPFFRSLRDVGDLVRVDLGTMPMYVATSADLIREITTTQARSFEKGRLYDRVRPLVGDGLATASGDTHRRHRRLIQPVFHHERIAGYAEIMSERARALTDSLSHDQRIELLDVMGSFTIETLAATMFSTDIGRSAVESVRRDLPVILRTMLVRAASPKILDWLPIGPNRAFDRAAGTMRQVIDDVIATARRAEGSDRTDLLTLLLEARTDEGEGLSDEEVRDELVTMLFAGTETTASTLTWALHELAHAPQVEKEVLAEVDDVVGTGPVTIDHVGRLHTIRRVLDETIRLHGVTLLMRRTVEPVHLGGHHLPAGAEVAFSLYALHRDPALYPEPDRFDPDRWKPERQSDLPRHAYVPFGSGNRKCIGDAFSWTEATITLATLLSRWQLRPTGEHTTREAASAMAHPDRVPMRIVARDH